MERRGVVHFNVTTSPTAEWTAQQIREAFPWEAPPKYLLRDRYRSYDGVFRKRMRAIGFETFCLVSRRDEVAGVGQSPQHPGLAWRARDPSLAGVRARIPPAFPGPARDEEPYRESLRACHGRSRSA